VLCCVQGLPKAAVKRQAEELLSSVKLTTAGTMRTAAYSGGMRRRLRCAALHAVGPMLGVAVRRQRRCGALHT